MLLSAHLLYLDQKRVSFRE